LRLYARVGAALITAHDDEQDAFAAINAVISWERFRATVGEAQALARPETFDAYQKLGEHCASIRRWSPAFVAAFEFESVPASASLMRAIEVASPPTLRVRRPAGWRKRSRSRARLLRRPCQSVFPCDQGREK
jgi:hypothetical protein